MDRFHKRGRRSQDLSGIARWAEEAYFGVLLVAVLGLIAIIAVYLAAAVIPDLEKTPSRTDNHSLGNIFVPQQSKPH